MKLVLTFMIIGVHYFVVTGQDINCLYYSNKNNLSGELIILDDYYSVVTTPYVLYLLDKERLIVDTLIFESKRDNIHQIQRIAIIDKSTISVASFFKSSMLCWFRP